MTPRTLRWVTGGVAALPTAFLLSALPLSYLSRHTVPGGWNVPGAGVSCSCCSGSPTGGRVDPAPIAQVLIGLDQVVHALAGGLAPAPGSKVHVDPRQ